MKRLKTKHSARKIPIHSVPIELGFIEYCEKVKTSKSIWRNLEYNQKNGFANLFQKWYQRFNRAKITKNPLKVFHSFRHNVTDSLKQIGVDAHLIAEIDGHATGSITMERYGALSTSS